jgi:Ser/Thr protein kinase RdoA (MazF antagonist)
VNYIDLSQDEQIALVSRFVPLILKQYPVEVETFVNINHGFNSSFKVTSKSGEHFALRINTNSKKSSSQVEAEIRLLELISSKQIVDAPNPVRTSAGQAYSKIELDFMGKEVFSVLNYWIEGDDLGDEITDAELIQLGAAMAKLHKFSKDIPDELVRAFPRIDQTLFNSPDNLRKNDPRFDSEMRNLINQAFEISEAVYTELSESASPILIHADLHPSNILKKSNGIAVIDFDDVGIGFEIQDLAITFFYLRNMPGKEELVAEGYRSVAQLPELKENHVEALLLSRQLLLLNDLLDMTTAEEIAFTPEYIEITRLRIKHFLDTGRFELIKLLN